MLIVWSAFDIAGEKQTQYEEYLFRDRMVSIIRDHDASQPLLLFYAGWNYETRMKLVQLLGEDPDPEVFVRRAVPTRLAQDQGGALAAVNACSLPHRYATSPFCYVLGTWTQWTRWNSLRRAAAVDSMATASEAGSGHGAKSFVTLKSAC